MTDEKRRDEAREIVHRLRDRYNAPGHELKLDLVEATDLVVAALASRDTEIERLRSDYKETVTYNIDERAKRASLLKEKDAEIERLQQWVSRLNNREAAARLRAQPAADAMTEDEKRLAEAQNAFDDYRREYVENISPCAVDENWISAVLEDFANGLLAEAVPSIIAARSGPLATLSAQPAAEDAESGTAREPVKVERHPGPFVGPDAELARAAAMAVIPWYGDDDEATHQRILKDGIWNDHVAVQAALAAIHHLRIERCREIDDARQDARRQALEEAARRPRQFLEWARETFGESALDRNERALRFIEEALELVHAIGVDYWALLRAAERVYGREAGDLPREFGQCLATLELLALVAGVDADAEATAELGRVRSIPKEEWARRHSAKVHAGFALADKPATTIPDIISLVRTYRRAVEASPVSNVLELQEWRDLCAAMNAIDAAEGAR